MNDLIVGYNYGKSDCVKVKLLVNKENEQRYKSMLEKAGFEISNDANLTFQEDNAQIDYIIGKDDRSATVLVYLDEIQLIETYGKDIIVHTQNHQYTLKGTMEYYQQLLFPYEFIRVSQSSIIHKRYITRISPALSMKFTVTLKNNRKVDVTRSYYYSFKEYIGL